MALAGPTGTFLTEWLLGRTTHFASFFRLMGTLTSICQDLANVLIDSVIVWLYSENAFRQANFIASISTFDIFDR
jgi:hypothetical protein